MYCGLFHEWLRKSALPTYSVKILRNKQCDWRSFMGVEWKVQSCSWNRAQFYVYLVLLWSTVLVFHAAPLYLFFLLCLNLLLRYFYRSLHTFTARMNSLSETWPGALPFAHISRLFILFATCVLIITFPVLFMLFLYSLWDCMVIGILFFNR